jgi:hypothetical protein
MLKSYLKFFAILAAFPLFANAGIFSHKETPSQIQKTKLTLNLPMGYFASLPSKDKYPTYVNGINYGHYGPKASDLKGAEFYTQCVLAFERWGSEQKTADGKTVSLNLTFLSKKTAYVEFYGFTRPFKYKVVCQEIYHVDVAVENGSWMSGGRTGRPVNLAQMQAMVLNAFPKGMVSITHTSK